jgi:hypothetical protein
MRELARYVLECDGDDAAERWGQTLGLVDAWLAEKGYTGDPDFSLRSGRQATLERTDLECSLGRLSTLKLLEEIEGGFFETTLQLACADSAVRVACGIAAGHGSNRIAPIRVEGRCPNVLRAIIEARRWSLGPTPITSNQLMVRGVGGGDDLVSALAHPDRSLPIVVISSESGLLLHPDLPARMARDLTALALVAVADEQASWRLTDRVGKALSCYAGAVRLYWPGFQSSDPVTMHPLWTANRLLHRTSQTDYAARTICDTLRRRLMTVSIAALAEPSLIVRLRDAEANERATALRKEMRDQDDYKGLAESYATDNAELRVQVDALKANIETLRAELYRLQTTAVWAGVPEDLEPDLSIPPSTIEEAIDRARTFFAGLLVFGDDVADGVATLAPQAGPPEKIFDYLQALSELVQARRAGPLGRGMLQWLADRNIDGSPESETVIGNRADMARRVWHDGTSRRQFELHLKPKESTHPDQCVRIYFDRDEARQQIVIGWVGRHP